MTRGRVTGSWAIAAAMAIALLSGCAPAAPAPSPTPTGFASEEEAFAAAEETYRAYVAALNSARIDSSNANPYELLSGAALSAERDATGVLEERGWRISGLTEVTGAKGSWWTSSQVELLICVDSSETRVFDENGNDVTPSGRPEIAELAVRASWGHPIKITDTEVVSESC